MKISETASYKKHLNQHKVIHLNMQEFLSDSDSVNDMLDMLNNEIIKELEETYADKFKKMFESNLHEIYATIYFYHR